MGTKRRAAVKAPGKEKRKKRFVFKTFSQRLEEVDIDVFRSLDSVKFEPNEGSSFFHESLIQWRELNAAADFISAYEELLPLVQTLPQLLLHKKVVLNRLLKTLQPSALLSLQPILSLIAVLSRDLGEDFLQFLPQVFDAFVELLQQGCDADASVLEMVFTSASYMFKYLLKFLSKDLVLSLKITRKLRYYHQPYVRLFAAEAVSFLFKNASFKEIIKGVRKSLAEVERDSSEERISSCSDLFFYTLRGPSDAFHSRAGEVLKLLVNPSIMNGIRKQSEGVLEVLKKTFCSLCDDFEPDKLQLLWTTLVDEFASAITLLQKDTTEEMTSRVMQFVDLINTMVEFKRGRSVKDYPVLVDLASRLLLLTRKVNERVQAEFRSWIFTLLLSLVRSHWHVVGSSLTAIDLCSPPWSSAFESSAADTLLPFVKGLLEFEVTGQYLAVSLSIISRFIGSSTVEVLPMLLLFLQKTQSDCVKRHQQHFKAISSAVSDLIETSLDKLRRKEGADEQPTEETGLVWLALQCFPYLLQTSICLDYANVVGDFLEMGSASNRDMWECLLGTALSSHLQVLRKSEGDLTSIMPNYISFALKYETSPEVLLAVADLLDGICLDERTEFATTFNYQVLKSLEANLATSNSVLRLATLRILSWYEAFCTAPDSRKFLPELISVESSPLDLEHSRRCSTLISQIKVQVDAKKVPADIVSVIFRSLVGLLHIRFAVLWNPAMDCLISIVKEYGGPVRDDLLLYLSSAQEQCLNKKDTIDEDVTDGILGFWRSQRRDPRSSTPSVRVLISLLQVAQKVQSFIDSKSSQLLSLFFRLAGSKEERSGSITGNDWKTLLKEWLVLLEQLNGVRTLSQGPAFQQMLLNRFLSYSDPDIQSKALACLLNWREAFLTPYRDRLNNLVVVEKLRDELRTWDIGRESESIAGDHRQGLIPVILRIVYPKMKGGKARKDAGASGRTSVLSFLSHLEPAELATFFILIFDPLGAAINAEGNQFVDGAKPRWQAALEQGCTDSFINWVDSKAVVQLPHKRKVGFLHLAKDLLSIFSGEQIEPYLHAILGFVLRILESAPVNDTEDSKEEAEVDTKDSAGKKKELRGLCLKFISSLFLRFENVKCRSEYWDLFFTAAEHSISSMSQENVRSNRPSAFLCCILAVSRNSDHATLLLRKPELISNVLSVMAPTTFKDQAPVVKTIAPPVYSAVLGIVENLVMMQNDEIHQLLEPHMEELIKGLASQLSSEKKLARNTLLLHRQLLVLSHLVHFVKDSQVPVFLDALLPFFTLKKHVTAEICAEVLKIANCISCPFDSDSATKCLDALCSLFTTMPHQEARSAACQLLQKIAQQSSSLSLLAELLEELNAMSTSTVGELDYERRQRAYEKMNDKLLSACTRVEATLLLSQLVFDLQTDEMRYSASSCLLSFIKAIEGGIFQQAVEVAVQDFLFSQFKVAIKSEDAALRMEWLIVFRQLVNCGSVKKISEFKCLTSSDQEADFFSNIVHIQVHRKVKAMAKFRAKCSAGHFSQESLKKVFVPLFMHSLFESRGQNDGIVDAAVETLGNIAEQLGWSSYFSLLMRCFYLLAAKGDYQKTLVRLICIILTKIASHFNTSRGEELPSEEDKTGAIVEALQRNVLPELEKLMLLKDSVNVPIALATVNVLKLMPPQVMERELPRIIQTVTNLLKSRVQDTRDEARSAIVGIAEALGASYFQFILKTLQASLRRGYEKHVLGFTVNAILIRTVPKMAVGEINYCLKELLSIIEDEIFGEVAEEKEVQELANKMKERKQARSYDSVRLVAQAVTFKQSIEQLLEPARKRVTSAKMQDKVRALLKSIAAGFQANASATPEEVLVLSRKLVEEFLNQEATKSQAPAETSSVPSLHLLAEFGLQLLHLVLKNNEAYQQPDAEMVAVLDPFVGLLQKCLSVKFEGVISAALKSLSLLSRLPLPSTETVGAEIASRVFVIAGTSSNADNPVLQACLKLIVVILRCWKSLSLSDDQLHLLLQLPIFIDIEGAHALSLLKAIVEKKLLVPEIYDLMDRVQLLMITSQVPSIQKRSSEVLLQFLLDYPLGENRLRHHLNYLLTNLGYEHISGREAALEMLHTVITKFPVEAWESQAESFFLTLVTRLTNEKEDRVRGLLETAIKVLMERVDPLVLQRMAEFSLSWMKGDKRALWFPAAQVTGLLVDVMGSKFKNQLPDFLPALSTLLYRASSSGDWREPYYLLLVYEKLASLFPDHELHRQQDLWSLFSGLLVHKQSMVMSKSSQLFNIYIERHRQEALLSDASWVLLLASYFCQQLDLPTIDRELGIRASENLTVLVPSLHSMRLAGTFSNVKEQQQARLQKALSLLSADTAVESQENPPVLLLVLRKLEKTALRYQVVQTTCIFRWYSSFTAKLGGKEVAFYLPTILRPLLKISDSTEASEELKKLAEEVRNNIRSTVAAESFAQAHNEVMQKMKMRKEKRKQAESIRALVDPEKHARKKIRLGLKKVVQKKRKRAEFGKK